LGTKIVDLRPSVGSGSGGGFSSTKALEFDGTDDYVSCGANATLQPTGAFTVSGWIYIDDLANNNVILANNTSVGANGYVLWITAATTNAIFTVYTGATYGWVAVQGTTSFVTGQWYHVAGTYEGTSADMKIYVNGQLENTVTSSPATIAYGTEGYIGKYNVQRTEGKIDEVALFGSALGAPVIDSIFNSGVPTDLTSLSPIAWWRCGENATFKSPQILMPEQSNKDKVSNFSMDFDGTSDYVDCGSYSLLNSGTSVTASVWFKSSVYTDYGRLLMAGKHVEIYQSAAAYTVTQGRFYYRLRGTAGIPFATFGGASATGVGDLCDGDWHHLCIVWDNSTTTAIIYEDGVPVITDTSVTGTLNPATQSFYIGAETSVPANPIQGSIDEVSIWDTALSPTDVAAVYGGGTPSDLTSLSPITWYRMGEEATFDPIPTEWTIPDQAGSNDGTSANMDIYTRIGDAPDSLNNALSYNMDAADIVPR